MVEDSADDALLVTRELQRAGHQLEFERVDTASALQAALDRQAWDLIIADHSMPGFSGFAALTLVRERGLDVPFIFVSGTLGEDVAVEAMKAGANDYVVKGNLKRLLPAMERELREAQVRWARRRAEVALAHSEQRLMGILESALDALVTMNGDGVITGWSPQAETIFGWTKSDALGRTLAETVIPPPSRDAHRRGLARFLATGEGPILRRRLEVTALHKSGREFPVELTITPVRLGDVWEFSAFVRDITERKRTERLLAAQNAVPLVLSESATLAEAVPRVLQAVCECLSWDVGGVWMIDRQAQVLRCVDLWCAPAARAERFVALSRRMTLGVGVGLPGRVWASGG
ncbi:MAG TPA: PAS domain S-box protein, partial [Gemmatimonadales bacterium]